MRKNVEPMPMDYLDNLLVFALPGKMVLVESV
jgi:hypothetical protein